jgi:hypothetical protein
MQDYMKHIEHEQIKEDRPDVPDQCPTCKGTGEIRFDFVNKDRKTINGYVFLPGVNITVRPCECMDSDAEARLEAEGENARSFVAVQIVQPIQITVAYEPPPPSVIYGECRGCHAEGEITGDGYCYNC